MHEKDPAAVMLKGYNSKCRFMYSLTTCFVTFCYVISIMTSLTLIKNRSLGNEDTRDIYEYVLLSTVVYLVVQIEFAGEVFLDILFQQFDFEVIETTPPKHAWGSKNNAKVTAANGTDSNGNGQPNLKQQRLMEIANSSRNRAGQVSNGGMSKTKNPFQNARMMLNLNAVANGSAA